MAWRLAVGFAFVTGMACDDTRVQWHDPEVVAGDATAQHGPTTLIVGFGQGPAFTPLDEAPTQVVVRGLQGGTWSMPTLRADTLASALAVECTLTTSAGERLGHTNVTTPTRPSIPGWVEIGLLPIPVSHGDDRPIADLEGVAATLACAVTALGATAEAHYAVVLDVP